MIGYIMLGINNLVKVVKYYDELFVILNVECFLEIDCFVVWSIG